MSKLSPIIDVHQHASLARFEKDGTPARNIATGEPSTAKTDMEQITETLRHMDLNNIDKSFPGGDPERIKIWGEAAPDRFVPTLEIRGNPITPSVAVVRELLETDSIKAIGEILVQYDGIPPNDPRLDPYFSLAEEYDIPAWIHTCGFGAFIPTFRVKHGNPLLIEDVIEKHPDLRLSICHNGFPFKAEIISMLFMYPKLHVDISAQVWTRPRPVFYDYLKDVLEYSKAYKRVMFGSDQMCWPEAISMAVDTLQNAPFLTENQKRDIFYNNAKRFFRL